ncbi:MAG: carbohydrate ABC transporter permease [Clostridiales bacterium]|jgi:putative aldouronate transport system permease protein|nr:carbohydrate ABC transporter permease [Clostridiales bacterium]
MSAKRTKANKRKADVPQIIIIAMLGIWALVIFYPFYNALLTSIVPFHVAVNHPFMLYPPELDFSSYYFIFNWPNMIYGLRTTLFIVVIGVMYGMFLTVTMAYVLSTRIPGRRIVNGFIVFTMFFSGGLIPTYLLMRDLRLVNSYLSMILPFGVNIMYMMIMRSYFSTISPEYAESARIDGAGEFTILRKIYLPLSTPMLATIGLFIGVDRWNEWYNGMLYITDSQKRPLQLLVRNIISSTQIVTDNIPTALRPAVYNDGIQMAAVMVAILPVALVFPFLQKYFVKGISLGGVKM